MLDNDRLVEVKIVAEDGAIVPSYQTKGAAGCDVCAYLTEPFVLEPGEFSAIPTGLYLEIPEGFEIQVRPRSGLSFKNGITILNAPGTIDSDYRGEVKIILINHGNSPFIINDGDRIAQLVLTPVFRADFVVVDKLSETARGEGSFGSTGISD